MAKLSSVFQADQMKGFHFRLDYEIAIDWSQIKLQTEKKRKTNVFEASSRLKGYLLFEKK